MTTDQTAAMYRNRASFPANHRYHNHPHHHRRRDRPPGSPLSSTKTHSRPNFVIELRSLNTDQNSYNRHEIVTLMGKLKCDPDDFFIYDSGVIAGRFFYQQWSNALETIVYLWKVLLDGYLSFMPRLVQNLVVPSDREELNSRLRVLFKDQVLGFLEGDLVRKFGKKLEEISNEIAKTESLLKKPKKLAVHRDLSNRKEGHVREKVLLERKIREFRSAMECILDHLDGKVFDGSEVWVLMLKGAYDWSKLYWMIKRECQRLNDGLPIYADRKDILWQIHCQQVMVLIGETGSGKSTQLVQFLADSGVAADKSIVCTQPRKLAAISLAKRVEEETHGCYEGNSVICSATYSSLQQLDSKVIYMTDHCLLQHYMNDKNFSWASCIIVDEAHERSLNTDLLLALIKDLLQRRSDLRFIIMSATADADQLSKYFFGCSTYHVVGRTFPVEVKYVSELLSSFIVPNDFVASYVSDVLRVVGEIHRTEEHGTILAFLTSQMEVEWACEQFKGPAIVSLPLHGRLSHEEQYRVYVNYPNKRKVIFSTNLAETSLTIPGVKYVVDSGMVKENRFEPGSGMNVLRVCKVSQSSANQRAGRAGRTEPGKCYRVYGENDFRAMPSHQEPEIRRVNLGIAVLRILSLGIHKIEEFDFIDAPSNAAIETAIKNLIYLGAIVLENDIHKLTKHGRMLVKLGIEPRLGKMILKCFENRLGREGLVLAAVMANSSSIFCRVGKEEEKQKSDCLKVQFCHPGGDLFTLLSVYRKWERVPHDKRNQWCWDNSINAKSMRRCQEAVQDMESCLQHELNIIIPSYWRWDPEVNTEHDKILRDVIVSALADNLAMYSGNDNLGYEVASTGTHIQLHPSCSLLIFGERPDWIVFGEIIAMPNQYLVCVTSIDFDSLQTLSPAPFDISQIDNRKLQVKVLTGFGTTLLKRFCGKSNSGLKRLVSCIKDTIHDDRFRLDVSVDHNEVNLFASSEHISQVSEIVNSVLEREGKWLQNECFEKCLFTGRHVSPPVALLGSGAEIKHLELEKRCLTVDIFVHGPHEVEEKELLSFLENHTSGEICAVHKLNAVGQDSEKWGRVTFLTPEAAEKAIKLTPVDFIGFKLKVAPSRSIFGGDSKVSSFPAVKAKVKWPRRRNRGFAFVQCNPDDVAGLVEDFSNVLIGNKFINCRQCMRDPDSVYLSGIDADVFEAELSEALYRATNRRIIKVNLPRAAAVENPPTTVLEEALLREVSSFMPPAGSSKNECVSVHVFPCEALDYFMKAEISFDGSLHLEAAKALEQIDGKALPGCQPWQKIKCQQQFNSSVSCPSAVYSVIKDPLHSLLRNLELRKGAEFFFERNENGTYRVKISAKATKIMAESRRPLEQLMNGRTIIDDQLTPSVIQLIFSREGFSLQKSIQRETGTFFLFDRHNQSFRVFGPLNKLDLAKKKLVQSLVALHENRQLDVHLRGPSFPPDLMKKVVDKFGPDLHGLKERFPESSDFMLNTRHHSISVRGSKELKQKVEETIHEIVVQTASCERVKSQTPSCPICLCDVEDGYRLEKCKHEFCRSCLVEQFESAIKNPGNSFPVRCAYEGCKELILVVDIKSLLLGEKLEELFRASLGWFVASSCGKYRFCPSPDCPSVYQVAEKGDPGRAFTCGSCWVETCTRCHLEYHQFWSCEKYKEFKRDPDLSLKEWMKGKEEEVRHCPVCGFTIEKIEGCNHIECRCGIHICWVCLDNFKSSDECYAHLRSIHHAIV